MKLEGVNIGKRKKINIVAVFNNGKIKEVADEIREMLDEWTGNGGAVIVVGDFNARIGKWQIDSEGENSESRESEDRVENNEEHKLVSFCEEVEGSKSNGSMKGDWEGTVMYKGERKEGGGSVLDLIIEIRNERDRIVEQLVVGERLESDHLPVEIYMESA